MAFLLAFPCTAVSDSPRVIDNADILTQDEEDELCRYLDEISERNEVDVAVHTTQSLDGYSAMDYADSVYESYGYGFGDDHDGTLLLIAMDEREWWITTEGFGITALTDYNLMNIEDEFVGYLSSGDYLSGFMKYAELCDYYISQTKEFGSNGQYDDRYYSNDSYYEPYYSHMTPELYSRYEYHSEQTSGNSYAGMIIISLTAGFVIALIVVSTMKGQLKSVRRASGASSYEVPGSLNVTRVQDIYLYRTVAKRRIDNDPPQNGSSNRGGRGGGHGGSSIHHSSSGRSHGGRGGRF